MELFLLCILIQRYIAYVCFYFLFRSIIKLATQCTGKERMLLDSQSNLNFITFEVHEPKVLMKVLFVQSCPTLCDPMDCSPSGSSVHGILQARILEWVVIPFSREPSWLGDWTWVPCIGYRFFTVWATREPKIITKALGAPVFLFHRYFVTFKYKKTRKIAFCTW